MLLFQSDRHDASAEPAFSNPAIIRPTRQPAWIPASDRTLDKDGPEGPFLQLEEAFLEATADSQEHPLTAPVAAGPS